MRKWLGIREAWNEERGQRCTSCAALPCGKHRPLKKQSTPRKRHRENSRLPPKRAHRICPPELADIRPRDPLRRGLQLFERSSSNRLRGRICPGSQEALRTHHGSCLCSILPCENQARLALSCVVSPTRRAEGLTLFAPGLRVS